MARLLTLVALFLLFISQTVLSSPCIAFDANWNLLAFGLNNKDYNAATQDKWTGSKLYMWLRSTPLTAVDRPRLRGSGDKASDVTISGRP